MRFFICRINLGEASPHSLSSLKQATALKDGKNYSTYSALRTIPEFGCLMFIEQVYLVSGVFAGLQNCPDLYDRLLQSPIQSPCSVRAWWSPIQSPFCRHVTPQNYVKNVFFNLDLFELTNLMSSTVILPLLSISKKFRKSPSAFSWCNDPNVQRTWIRRTQRKVNVFAIPNELLVNRIIGNTAQTVTQIYIPMYGRFAVDLG
jgi:hypothetical protein